MLVILVEPAVHNCVFSLSQNPPGLHDSCHGRPSLPELWAGFGEQI